VAMASPTSPKNGGKTSKDKPPGWPKTNRNITFKDQKHMICRKEDF